MAPARATDPTTLLTHHDDVPGPHPPRLADRVGAPPTATVGGVTPTTAAGRRSPALPGRRRAAVPTRRRVTLLAALVAPLLALGCSAAPAAAPAPTSAAPAPSTAPPATATVTVAPVTVALSDPGQEPRRTLALDLGPSQQVTLTTTAGIVQTVGGQDPVDLSSPQVSVPLGATPGTATEPGAARPVDLELGTPTSPDAILAGALGAEAGSRAVLAVLPTAAVERLSITPAAGALDTARSAVEQALRQAVQLGVALPAAEVGVGARWTVSQQLDSLGLKLRQDVTVTLLEVAGTTVRLGVALAQTPLDNTWTLPDSGGTTFSVDSYPMQGTGELTLDLRRPLPVAGTLQLAGRQVYTRTSDRLSLAQDVTNKVEWSS